MDRMDEGKESQKGEEERVTRLKHLVLNSLGQIMGDIELQQFMSSTQFSELSPELYRHLDVPYPDKNEIDKCSDRQDEVKVHSESFNPPTYVEKLCSAPEVRSTLSTPDLVLASIKKQDISEGQERFPIAVVNTVDEEEAPLFKYINENIFADDVKEKVYSGIDDCCGCECVDDCKDKFNCRCFIRTLNHYFPKSRKKMGDENIGYELKMLPFERRTMSGIFECNKNCKCKESCVNRVVQLGTECRLQLFKASSYKGWGVKTLTDIPAGTFISNYSGMIIRDDAKSSSRWWKHSKDWWKYLIKLEIETPIQNKRQQLILQNGNKRQQLNLQNRNKRQKLVLQSLTKRQQLILQNRKKRQQLILQNIVEDHDEGKDEVSQAENRRKLVNSPDSGVHSMNPSESPSLSTDELSISGEENSPVQTTIQIPIEYFQVYERDETAIKKVPPRKSLCPPSSSVILRSVLKKYWPSNYKSDSAVETKLFELGNRKHNINSEIVLRPRLRHASNPTSTSTCNLEEYVHSFSGHPTSQSPDKDSLPRLNLKFKTEAPFINGSAPWYCTLAGLSPKIAPKIRTSEVPVIEKVGLFKDESFGGIKPMISYSSIIHQQCRVVKKTGDTNSEEKSQESSHTKKVVKEDFGKSNLSTSYARIKKNCRYSFRSKIKKPKPYILEIEPLNSRKKLPRKYRLPVVPINNEYALDGREYGNIGRFYNHSCDPNMFPQYIFVDNHDIRFPGVSYFAKKDIRAGEELTWDYNYEINTYAAGPIIKCMCLAKNCTERLC